jgi:large subunit ribosomal protein L23
MGLLDRFKKTREKEVGKKKIASKILSKEKEAKKKEVAKARPEEPRVGRKKVETGLSYKYLIKPMVSEKSSILASRGKYVFIVHPEANKIEVAKAIQNAYDVKVRDVNIINMSGKAVRFGRVSGRTKNWKKAIVTLEPGQKIEIYEGV